MQSTTNLSAANVQAVGGRLEGASGQLARQILWKPASVPQLPAVGVAVVQAHPGVPVVENLEDLWMVSKLQGERKARDADAKRARLARMHPPPPSFHESLTLSQSALPPHSKPVSSGSTNGR